MKPGERALYATWLVFVAVRERRAMPQRAFSAYYGAMESVIPAATLRETVTQMAGA